MYMKNTKFILYWKNLINFFRDKQTDWKPKIAVAVAVVYLIWPLDLIPDLAPFFGWLDDIGITTFTVAYLGYAINKYIKSSNIKLQSSNAGQIENHNEPKL